MAEQGKVKWFSKVKGFGFLQKEGLDKDIFVHYSVIQGEGYKTLVQDEEVTFDLEEGEKGPIAKNVVRVKREEARKAAAEKKPEADKPAAPVPVEEKKEEAKPEEKAEKKPEESEKKD